VVVCAAAAVVAAFGGPGGERGTAGRGDPGRAGSQGGAPVIAALALAAVLHRPSYDYSFNDKVRDTLGGWTEVEWRSNNHGNGAIQDRTYCADAIAPWTDYWSVSGVVRKAGVWDRAGCNDATIPVIGQVRFAVPDGAPWGSWGTWYG
jgi:hypothetical protein